MLRSMLVGLDGSTYSDAALDLAIRWAKRLDAFVVGIAVLDEPTICAPLAVPLGAGAFKEERDAELVADAQRRISAFRQQFTARCQAAGVKHEALEKSGVPHEQISLEAHRYDLVLLGRETHFHFETQPTADETLEKVLKSSPRPLVAVPESPHEGQGILVGYDGSVQAARALQLLVASGLHALGKVQVLCVNAKSKEIAAGDAKSATDFLSHHGIQAEAHPTVTGKSVGDVILEETRRLNVELLVLGAFGRSTWREFLMGSVTSRVLHKTPVPVFLYH